MSTGAKKLMVIHDASRTDGLNAIILAFETLPVESGDELTLLAVIHQLPSPLKIKSISGSNTKNKDDERIKKEEYYKREEVMQLSTICARNKIDVQSGSSPKSVAAKAAKTSKVTWVVLDRQMKKDRKYFMEKLSCGILRMKRDNTIEKLREPITMEDKKLRSSKSNEHFSYGEMIPVMSKRELSPKKTPNVQKPTFKPEGGGSSGAPPWDKSQFSSSPPSTGQISSSPSKASTSSFGFSEVSTMNSSWTYDYQEEEEFEYSVCSVCQNKRPSNRLKQLDFNYTELYQATDGFSRNNFLSEGGFGSVYKGELNIHGGVKVAVKQHKDASCQGEKEFKSEVNVLSMARHPNLVMLLGSCSEGTHRLLVYEFICFGSLDQHLSSKNPNPLTWDKRIKIALGAARGLDYLHRINIVHRDMRPNNILVTHDYESLLGDFGLARTDCGDTDETGVVGTLGYVAPEYAECGKVSTKTDVYSFGVVLLQLITGCKTKEKKFDGKTLVEWARPLVEDKNYPDLIDERIADSPDVQVFQLYLMVQLAEECLKKDPTKRQPMAHVAKQLECIMEGITSYREVRKC
ncbi:hypothetical protein L2E82_39704 [Cichorium intybus]|uniref:Uncharacterized protein n=1 Tax=Cichorium intybus TaxID=13427 RepID=A0ACB9AI92_CICIN|nr:hypothetical protein L2E82_39704 [Cichorium intybus]